MTPFSESDRNALLSAGVDKFQAGDLNAADGFFRRVLDADPNDPDGLHLLGLVVNKTGDPGEAIKLLEKAVKSNPADADFSNNLGQMYKAAGRLEAAAGAYRAAIKANPNFSDAHSNLGNALAADGKTEDAIGHYKKALAIDPNNARAHYNLATTLLQQENLSAAIEAFRTVVTIDPNYTDAYNNLGMALHKLGQLDEAVATYHKAIAIKPDYADARFNLGMVQLLTGDFQNGWDNYDCRWQATNSGLHPRDYREPFWDGSPLKGKTIFLYPEQGLGDNIQFARYIPLVVADGGRVIFEVKESMFRLFQGMKHGAEVLEPGKSPPPFDCHVPLLNLPRLLNTTLENIPADIPYLHADRDLVEAWGERLGAKAGFRVGLVWGGSPGHLNDRNRSIEPELFRPLVETPGVEALSLMVGRDGESGRVFGDAVTDLAPELTDFADTAAAIANMDLVISVDTAAAHLAGALGTMVWTLLPFNPDWRWMLDRDDSPWYPTMRLFRQQKRGDWNGVFERVYEALRDQLRNSRG